MTTFGKKLRHWAGDGKEGYFFWCPGCNESHMVQTSPSGWGFNGSGDAPTFTPSVLVRTGHYCNPGEQPGTCACDFQQRFPDREAWPWPCMRCHSFVTDGRIQFLTDCTHALAGQTVDLPDYPSNGD